MAERGCQELAALVLHIAAELISGAVLVLAPQLFVPGEISVDHTESLRGIGNGALSIGLLGLALLLSDESAGPWWAYAVVAQYHAGVVILQLKHPLLGLPYWLAPSFHGWLLLMFARMGWRRFYYTTPATARAVKLS